jgi:hypothetical protein
MVFYCHPDNVKVYMDKIELELKKDSLDSGIHHPFGIKIIGNDAVPKTIQKGWRRTKLLQDNQYCTMVDNLDNPPSWAIYFGFVEPIMDTVIYEVDESKIVFSNPKTEFKFTAINRGLYPFTNIQRKMILSTSSF